MVNQNPYTKTVFFKPQLTALQKDSKIHAYTKKELKCLIILKLQM